MSGVLDEQLTARGRAETSALAEPRASQSGEPTTEILDLFPRQGEWTEGSFLETVGQTPRYEFAWGRVERLPMVFCEHQDVVEYLFEAIKAFVQPRRLGKVRFSPLRIRLPHGHYREPDIVYLSATRVVKRREYPEGADLVVEIVSGSGPDRRRDTVDKRADYALGGIPEYWIVDPDERTITVLALEGAAYREAGIYHPGDKAASVLLDGLLVDVAACFAAGDGATIGEEPTK